MSRRKILICHSEQVSSWRSCEAIASNLLHAYRGISQGVEFFPYRLDWAGQAFPGSDLRAAFAAALGRFQPDEVVFLDHRPHPLDVLKLLSGGIALPAVSWGFHVYGDFTVQARKWFELGMSLRGKPVRLLAASPRHAALTRRLLERSEASVEVVPFPVDTGQWSFDQAERDLTRTRFGLAEVDRVVLYSGRLSVQKSVVRLVREFAQAVDQGLKETQLWLVGPFDDRDGRLFGLRTPTGYSFQKYQAALEGISSAARARIRRFDPVDPSQLLALYRCADVFASLSLYHNEDFGMSPAEALSTGLPAVLSDWGGYAAFDVPGVSCSRVSVGASSGVDGLSLSSKEIQSGLRSAIEASFETGVREERARAFAVHFSIAAVAARLNGVMNREASIFAGFNSRLERVVKLSEAGVPQPEWVPGAGRFYAEIYESYRTQ